MTVWENIYKDYQKGGEAWATLKGGLITQFVKFIDFNNFDKKIALDIGCGQGNYLKYLDELGFDITGIDSSQTAVDMAKMLLDNYENIFCADMFNVNLGKERYDLIISTFSIQHGIKSDISILIDKIYDALMVGGKIFITIPDLDYAKNNWNTFKDSKEISSGTFVPINGPEKGLAHSFYIKDEIKELFNRFKDLNMDFDGKGQWIITGTKL